MRLPVVLSVATAAMLVAAGAPRAVHAQQGLLSTEAQLQGCEAFVENAPTANQMQIGACAGGVAAALDIGQGAGRVCLPAGVNLVAAARAVTDFIQESAERRRRRFGELALEALALRWPCR
jgi:hypothetical protein